AETRTVIEHRNLGARPGRLVVDGEEIGVEPVEADGAAWAHLEGTGGYVLLEGTHLRAVQAEREGCWSRNHTAGSEEVLRRHYATLEAVHSAEHSSYAYAVLPGADEEATRRAASDPGAEVVRNDEVAQAIRAGRLLAMNFWAAGRVQNVPAQGPACVLPANAARTRELKIGRAHV